MAHLVQDLARLGIGFGIDARFVPTKPIIIQRTFRITTG